jgi:hypothetical protein
MSGEDSMHEVDYLPILFVGGIFLFIGFKIAGEYITARRAS